MTADPMIRLERLCKRFAPDGAPAVAELNLDIPAGEIVILVGPSGCGKTTTLRLINRLLEPSSGRILLGGEDVTGVQEDALRRRIGYAIQQVGLFPHMTVAGNIAAVPRMLGWDRSRVEARVDELLSLVGLDPASYRGRYPKALSGGQAQRVGVARALSGDPEVMLMDEPFGALDPITRASLQEEFLRVQSRVAKTIVFVTHDIDEALRMGDRIAVLGEGARVAQYGTPAQLLTQPAEEFVAAFIGGGAAVRRLGLTRVAEIDLPAGEVAVPPGTVVLGPRASLHDALDVLLRAEHPVVAISDVDGNPRGTLDLDTLRRLIRTETPDPPAAGATR